MNASREQKLIVDAVLRGEDVVVDAVSGAGKSMTVFFITQEMPESVLYITYNKQLRIEMQTRIPKAEVHTYHSMANKYYAPVANDVDLEKILAASPHISPDSGSWKLLVLDEIQDMRMLYYRFVQKIFRDFGKMQLLILGDRNQCIYEFGGANPEFLTDADRIWKRKFTHLQLRTTYRCTIPIARFVNSMLGEQRLISRKSGHKVMYIMANQCEIPADIVCVIRTLIARHYRMDDIFILVPSMRSDLPKRIENQLVSFGYYVHYNINEDAELDSDIIREKIVFSTMHQAKGLERKIVILLNFDDSYFRIFNRDADPSVCPNIHYVAATRASELLYVIHSTENSRLPYLHAIDTRYVYYRQRPEITAQFRASRHGAELVRYIKPEYMTTLYHMVSRLFDRCVDSGKNQIDNVKCEFYHGRNVLCEDVSDITAHAVVSMFIDMRNEKPIRDIPEYLALANKQVALRDGIMCRIRQINRYDWIRDFSGYLGCLDRIEPGDLSRDMPIAARTYKFGNRSARLAGQIDIYNHDSESVWQVEYAQVTRIEHLLRLIVLTFICNATFASPPLKYKLINIRTREIYEYRGSPEDSAEAVAILIKNRTSSCSITDYVIEDHLIDY